MKICKKRSKSFIFSNLLWGNLCLGFFEALVWAHQRAPGSQDSACGGYSRDAPIDSEDSKTHRLLTSQETHPPEAWVEWHADVCGLVERKDDALLQVEPVICAHGDPQQAQGANRKHAAQQRQRLPAT